MVTSTSVRPVSSSTASRPAEDSCDSFRSRATFCDAATVTSASAGAYPSLITRTRCRPGRTAIGLSNGMAARRRPSMISVPSTLADMSTVPTRFRSAAIAVETARLSSSSSFPAKSVSSVS